MAARSASALQPELRSPRQPELRAHGDEEGVVVLWPELQNTRDWGSGSVPPSGRDPSAWALGPQSSLWPESWSNSAAAKRT
eukprot:6787703-Alexandrium_andersonii.AAC.1